MQHRAFVDQREQDGPRRQVQGRYHIQRTPGAPRRSSPPMLRHLDAERFEVPLNLAVVAMHPPQDSNQLPRHIHDDVVVKNRPSDMEHTDQVVIDKKVDWRRSRFPGKPANGPVLKAKIADRAGRFQ